MRRELRSEHARERAGGLRTLRVVEWTGARVDVEPGKLVQPEDVNEVELDGHLVPDLLRIAEVPLLCVWRLEVLIKHATTRAGKRIRQRARNCRRRRVS